MKPYKILHIPGYQRYWEPYDDCYGKYKFAMRTSVGYVALSTTNPRTIDSTISRHRWVYENEHGEIPKGYCVNHKNRIRGDDHPDNLEALSPSEHARKHNREKWTGKIPLAIPYL